MQSHYFSLFLSHFYLGSYSRRSTLPFYFYSSCSISKITNQPPYLPIDIYKR